MPRMHRVSVFSAIDTGRFDQIITNVDKRSKVEL